MRGAAGGALPGLWVGNRGVWAHSEGVGGEEDMRPSNSWCAKCGHSHWIPYFSWISPRLTQTPAMPLGHAAVRSLKGFYGPLKKIGGLGAHGTQNLWAETASTIGSK